MQLGLNFMTGTADHLQALLSREAPPRSLKVVGAIRCADGTTISVQASDFHACSPRSQTGPYDCVEVRAARGSLPVSFELADEEDDPNAIYRFVPIDLVARLIDAHGGICPKDEC